MKRVLKVYKFTKCVKKIINHGFYNEVPLLLGTSSDWCWMCSGSVAHTEYRDWPTRQLCVSHESMCIAARGHTQTHSGPQAALRLGTAVARHTGLRQVSIQYIPNSAKLVNSNTSFTFTFMFYTKLFDITGFLGNQKWIHRIELIQCSDDGN